MRMRMRMMRRKKKRKVKPSRSIMSATCALHKHTHRLTPTLPTVHRARGGSLLKTGRACPETVSEQSDEWTMKREQQQQVATVPLASHRPLTARPCLRVQRQASLLEKETLARWQGSACEPVAKSFSTRSLEPPSLKTWPLEQTDH